MDKIMLFVYNNVLFGGDKMILYHTLSEYDRAINPESNGLISKFIIDEVLNKMHKEGTLKKIKFLSKSEIDETIKSSITEINQQVMAYKDEFETYLELVSCEYKTFSDEAKDALIQIISTSVDRFDERYGNWVSLSVDPIDEKIKIEEQNECQVVCVDSDKTIENLEIYPKNFSVLIGNKVKYYTCVPNYKVAAILNACEYERIIYGISKVDDILTSKSVRKEKNEEYIKNFISNYPSDSFEAYLIREHLEKNRTLKSISNDDLDGSMVSAYWFINDTWDKMVKNYKNL